MRALLIASILTFAYGATAQAAAWTIDDIGNVQVSALNNKGQVIGYTDTSTSLPAAFSWKAGAFTTLPQLPGQTYSSTYAWGINDSGVIVGSSGRNAVVWNNGTPSALAPNPHFQPTEGYAINNKGTIAVSDTGEFFPDDISTYIVDNGQIGATVPGYTAVGLNDAGVLLGGTEGHGGVRGVIHDTVAGTTSYLSSWYGGGFEAINNQGVVVGAYAECDENDCAPGRPYNWTTHQFLPGGVGSAFDINDAGDIVGAISDPYIGTPHAVLWDASGDMLDLGSIPEVIASGWTSLDRAVAINDMGIILGYGTINGEQHAFLLSPVPEPSTYAFFGIGLAILGLVAKKRGRSTPSASA